MNKQYNINKSYIKGGSQEIPSPAEARRFFQDNIDKQKRVEETGEKRRRRIEARRDEKGSVETQLPSNQKYTELSMIDDNLDESESKKEEVKLMISVNKISKLIKKINSDFDNIVTVLLENPNFYLFKFDFEKCIYYAYNMPILLDFNTSLVEVESVESDKLNIFIEKINKLKSKIGLEYKIYIFYDIITFNYKEIDSDYLYKIKLYNQNVDKTTLFNFIKKEDSNNVKPVITFILEFKLTDFDVINTNPTINKYFLQILQTNLIKSWNYKFSSTIIFNNFCKREPMYYKPNYDDSDSVLYYNTCMMQFKILILSLITRFTTVDNFYTMEEKVNMLFSLEEDNFEKLNNFNTKANIKILIYIIYGLTNVQLKMILEDNFDEQFEIIKNIGSMYKELVIVKEGKKIGNNEAYSFITESLLTIPDYEKKIQYLLENLIVKESSTLKTELETKLNSIAESLDKIQKEKEEIFKITTKLEADIQNSNINPEYKKSLQFQIKDKKKENTDLDRKYDKISTEQFDKINNQIESLINESNRKSKYNTFIKTNAKYLLEKLTKPLDNFIDTIIF
jgi:hypothetical protein